jgi:hypothetical protein
MSPLPQLPGLRLVRRLASGVWLWPAGAIAASLIVEWMFVQKAWFFLDDIRNLAEARAQGLTWSFLTAPIGQHFTPGHRLLDWVVAVPLGGHWAGAIGVMLVFSLVMLAYLTGVLALLFGQRRRNAIPVLLAGTAWPLLGSAQWFAGGALAVPVATSIAGATFHHLRWRETGGQRDWAAAMAWTVAGLLFSEQAILIPAIVAVCALVARADRPTGPSVIREVAAALPLFVPALALEIYVGAQPWAASVSLPSVANSIGLVRVIVVRSMLPALAGIGMSGAPPDPLREVFMRAVATAGVGAALLVAVWLRRRWVAALVLAGSGVILTAAPIALARLSVVGVSMAGSEPRYLLPAVLLCVLAIGALLVPQTGRPARPLPAAAAPVTAVLGLAWIALYVANVSYTYNARRFSLDSGQAARHLALRLESGLRTVVSAGGEDAIVDGTLPFPLWYVQQTGNLRSAYGRFFIRQGIAAPGVPGPGGLLLSIASDGAIERVSFHPVGPSVLCADGRPCAVPVGDRQPQGGQPAQAGESALSIGLSRPAPAGYQVHYQVNGPVGLSPDRTLTIPAGARRFVIPAVAPDPGPVVVTFVGHPADIQSARVGLLTPA